MYFLSKDTHLLAESEENSANKGFLYLPHYQRILALVFFFFWKVFLVAG
jgi:hypothetical protein